MDDQDFIALARQDMPRLLDEVRRLRALPGAPCGRELRHDVLRWQRTVPVIA